VLEDAEPPQEEQGGQRREERLGGVKGEALGGSGPLAVADAQAGGGEVVAHDVSMSNAST
jgi:hypothetical protein